MTDYNSLHCAAKLSEQCNKSDITGTDSINREDDFRVYERCCCRVASSFNIKRNPTR